MFWPGPVGTGRSASPTLLTATVAAQHKLTIVHYDADFEIAAQVIDFDQRWIAERGTL